MIAGNWKAGGRWVPESAVCLVYTSKLLYTRCCAPSAAKNGYDCAGGARGRIGNRGGGPFSKPSLLEGWVWGRGRPRKPPTGPGLPRSVAPSCSLLLARAPCAHLIVLQPPLEPLQAVAGPSEVAPAAARSSSSSPRSGFLNRSSGFACVSCSKCAAAASGRGPSRSHTCCAEEKGCSCSLWTCGGPARSAKRGQGMQGTSRERKGKQHFVADVLQTFLDGGFGLVQILRTAPCHRQ
jgi:hypothetical protein